MDVTGETENLVLALLRDLRKDSAEQRTLLLATVDAVRRMEKRFDALEPRISHVRDDIELMVKAELMGRLGHFETTFDEKLDTLAARVAILEAAS